ncbi:MAG: adenylate kinase family protein [Halorubrum sp.]|uniref:adenylate kinase family protein n=1 Tax=Halorubrum sp. TaxID=1879286 RepID=UPI0039704B39
MSGESGADGDGAAGADPNARPLRVAVTGTPGTGKSTATALLEDEYDVIHLNDLIKGDDALWTERDVDRDTLVADLDAVRERLDDWSGVLDSHLAHRFAVDRVVVLRCHPETIEARLRERGEAEATAEENSEPGEPSRALARKAHENAEPDEPSRALARKAHENAEPGEPPRALARKAHENAESEALDVILSEAVAEHGVENVYEIDTTDRDPAAVADEIRAAIRGEREPSAGTVDFIDYISRAREDRDGK